MGDQDSIYDSSSKKASIIIGLKKEGLLSMCAFVWVDLKTIRLTLYFGYLYMPNQFDQKPYTTWKLWTIWYIKVARFGF